ncbi:MAG: class I SAM-dependent methyltransferase [Candidatus Methanogaster sp.]|uniref:Class I SAM-dependent methyltransferase n=1 Tax=Candidatus Methanogaster sp. TaxID=3386292 RepID=A0AC61L4K4_9EURY|nr:MAG: class I SAM-dependent methyltransferase [ANME-2 cluster archaeon]
MICKVCGNSESNKEFQIREMMFGFRDEFTYFECSECGCLQIAEIPKDMEKYYPSNYYSFKKGESNNFIKQILIRKRDEYTLLKKGLIGKALYIKYPNLLFDMISKMGVNYNSRILDVGCGAGNLLYSLNETGFTDLMGVDPYMDRDDVDGNVTILKKTIHELPDGQKFDLITSNHSFEHIPDQLETLSKISKILSENGVCLIRMPVKTKCIWNRYSVDWVQIDAPRHFFLHTLKSFELLVEKSGLSIQDVIFDSTEFQFWGSESYKRDVPLTAENSYSVNPKKSIFASKQIREFRKMANELNKNKQGDQAGFYLTRKK